MWLHAGEGCGSVRVARAGQGRAGGVCPCLEMRDLRGVGEAVQEDGGRAHE